MPMSHKKKIARKSRGPRNAAKYGLASPFGPLPSENRAVPQANEEPEGRTFQMRHAQPAPERSRVDSIAARYSRPRNDLAPKTKINGFARSNKLSGTRPPPVRLGSAKARSGFAASHSANLKSAAATCNQPRPNSIPTNRRHCRGVFWRAMNPVLPQPKWRAFSTRQSPYSYSSSPVSGSCRSVAPKFIANALNGIA